MQLLSEEPALGEDAQSFEFWVRPHWNAMAALARRSVDSVDWEDVLQEALSAAWRKRRQFDSARGTARNWLLAIVADQSYKSRRKLRPLPLAEPDRTESAPDTAPDLDLDRAIAALAPRQRLAVNLRYYLGLSLVDVAAVMECSEGTAKSTLSDARRRIRTQLGEDYR